MDGDTYHFGRFSGAESMLMALICVLDHRGLITSFDFFFPFSNSDSKMLQTMTLTMG